MFQPLCQHDFFSSCFSYILPETCCSGNSTQDLNFIPNFSDLLPPLQFLLPAPLQRAAAADTCAASRVSSHKEMERQGYKSDGSRAQEEHFSQVDVSTRKHSGGMGWSTEQKGAGHSSIYISEIHCHSLITYLQNEL